VPVNIKIFFFFILSTNVVFAQIVPSFQGVYDKKSTSFSTSSSLIFDGTDYIQLNGGEISTAWTVELWYKKSSNELSQTFLNKSSSTNASQSWALKLEQCCNTKKLGITKFNVADYTFSSSSAITDIDVWEHVVWAYESNVVTAYINGLSVGTISVSVPVLNWNVISQNRAIEAIAGAIDEIRIWNDLRTQNEIKSNMFKQLNGDESNLQAYYKMSTATGTTLVDNSSNSNDGTISGATWGANYVPLGNLNSSYQTDMEGLWEATGTSASQSSDGLTMTVSQTLSEENFAVFGNNNTSSTSTSDLPSGTAIRSARIWQVDKSGTVSANVIIDISEAIGDDPATEGAATNYKLLHRIGTSGNFTIVAAGASKSNGNITFSGVTVHKGFYVIAATDSSNL